MNSYRRTKSRKNLLSNWYSISQIVKTFKDTGTEKDNSLILEALKDGKEAKIIDLTVICNLNQIIEGDCSKRMKRKEFLMIACNSYKIENWRPFMQ